MIITNLEMCTNFRTNNNDRRTAVRIVLDLIIALHSFTNDLVLKE
ncbi:hypothetical protein B0H69_004431 [Clostridium beijerinckii]|nr:hypothetical protein [Clostridium beijerinckii]NRZ31618.1 hypothetical protein [Clostridium beijerinckii]NSA10831.1 hypothetical protein [Clostridium beijerinckii]NSA60648.1 hypothetical protein [Clostridium beijerinckii]NYC10119.1 hypothetical protein [Clostridium beijerinckii]